jgi:predicted HTH transcriptional regulator
MSYERSALSAAAVDDLDMVALAAFVSRRLPGVGDEPATEDLAVRLGLLHRMGSRLHPTPVGLLTFGRLPQLVHPEWGLAAVRMTGLTMSDPVQARNDVEGSLGDMLDAALAFVRAHTTTLDDRVSPGAPAAEYVEIALREALVNALVHRDLRRPARVALRIFDDRLEVWNPGGISEAVGDLDELVQRGGVSQPRNPILAATARVMGIGEQLGRGLCVMRRAITQLPNQRLEIRASNRDFTVVFPSQHCRPPMARPLV